MRMFGVRSLGSKKISDVAVGQRPKMQRPSIARLIVVLMLLLLCLQIIVPSASAKPILTGHYINMVQGDDPGTEEIEPEDEIWATERFFFAVPWNESWVEVPVPKVAHSMVINQVDELRIGTELIYVYGEYSADVNPDNPPFKVFKDMEDMDCCIADFYAWGFPAGAERNLTTSGNYNSGSAFNQSFNRARSDDAWNFSGTGLELQTGYDSADYLSDSKIMGINITKVEMTWNVSMHEENISFFVSDNNGTDWVEMNGYKGDVYNFTTNGSELLWKINMTQDIELNNTPVINDLWINVTYTPSYTSINIQLNYVLDRKSDKFEFVLDLYEDYNHYVTPHTIIYINRDHTLHSDDMPLTLFQSQTLYPDKDAYTFMSGGFSPETKITVQSDEEEQFPWLLIFIIIVLIVIVLIIIILAMTRAQNKNIDEYPIDHDSEASDEEIEELKKRKETLLAAIKKLDLDLEEGILDEEVHKELKSSYKKKAADVMKQMDTLAVSAAKAPSISQEREVLLHKKERILKSIKKLDSDFNDDLLDEDVYNELRADYKKKAVDIVKELDESR